jgi:hypothetical protein
MSKKDIGECGYYYQTALKYILGFISDIEGYIERLEDEYDEFEKESKSIDEQFSFLSESIGYKLHITVAQTKYNELEDELYKFFSKVTNLDELIGSENCEYIMSLPDNEKEEELAKLKRWESIRYIHIQGDNLIGEDRVEYEPGKIIKDYMVKWHDVYNKINSIVADSIKDYIKFEFEVYLENGYGHGKDNQLIEFPMLSVYLDKRLIMTRMSGFIKGAMEMLDIMRTCSEKKGIDYESPMNVDIISKLATADSENELYNEIIKLPHDDAMYIFDHWGEDMQIKGVNLQSYRKEYASWDVQWVGIESYDLVYSTFDQDEDYILYDVIDFEMIDKYLDQYIEDTDNGIIYDSLNIKQDLQYHMYSVLNILDKRINKEIVTEIYNNETHEDKEYYYHEAVKGMSWMRVRTEGIYIPYEWAGINESYD